MTNMFWKFSVCALSLLLVSCQNRETCWQSKRMLSSKRNIAEIRSVVVDQFRSGELSYDRRLEPRRGGVIGQYSVALDSRFRSLGIQDDVDERVVVSPEGRILGVFLAKTRLEGIVVNVVSREENTLIPRTALKFYSDDVALVCLERD